MDGTDWATGERLVEAKVEAAPAAKLRGAPLLDAILLESARRGVEASELFTSARQRDAYQRLVRGVEGRGELYTMHVDLVGKLADAAGVDVLDTYGKEFTRALAHREDRIDVRNRGYDLAQTLPKSFSVLLAYAPDTLAQELEEQVFNTAAHDTLRYAESVASYGMRGHHGDGKSAERIDTSGFVGWSLIHRTSRAGDPHHHVHLNVANMVRGTDGNWSAVGAGGRDLMRHTHAMGAFMEARTRHLLQDRYGVEVTRSERTGQWEIDGIAGDTLRLFSKRDIEIRAFLEKLGLTWQDAGEGQRRAARDVTRDVKSEAITSATDDQLRARWQAEGREHGDDPDAVVASIIGRVRVGAHEVDLDEVATQVFHPHLGITAHKKSFDRAAAFAAVLEQLPGGVPDLDTADRLVDAVLQRSPQAVALPPKGPQHMSDVDRYTTVDLVQAERAILDAAKTRRDEGAGMVSRALAEMALSTYEAGKGFELTEEQRAAYFRLVTAGHGVDALVGAAGSGKTTLMEAARMAWEAAGLRVAGAATAAVAVQNLQAETGIRSRTIASHMTRGLAADVLVIDEAAMVDERQMAWIVDAAAAAGTKVVGIGDPKQLRAAGVGGSFAHVHATVGGLTLVENRRQRDAGERAATALMRDGKFALALRAWSERDRVHVSDGRDEALAGLVLAWKDRRKAYDDPHAQIREVLMIAYTNADVDALNVGARAVLKDAGEVAAQDHVYRLAKGDDLALAVGDVVRVRQNLWSPSGPGLLNGHRGKVTEIREDGAVVVDWRAAGQHKVRQSVVTAEEIALGALSHGYAITDHAAQGQTADAALVYPVGMDANAAYPAVTRHREELHLFVPLDQVEDDVTQKRLGKARSNEERIARGVDALARAISVTREEMVSLELDDVERRRSGNPPAPPTSVPSQEAHPNGPTPPSSARNTYADALAAVLGASGAEQVRNSREHGALVATLHRVEGHGLDVAGTLTAAVNARELRSAESLARVLTHRLTKFLESADLAQAGPVMPRESTAPRASTESVGHRGSASDVPARTADAPATSTVALRAVVEQAADFYAVQASPRWVHGYLAERGLRADDLPSRAGYAPPSWTALVDHLRASGVSDEDMLAAGVAARSSRETLIDRLRDRLVLPIRDEQGVVAFVGRAEPGTDAPKWVNSPESAIYHKAEVLYGLAEGADALRRGATPVLVEGPLDVAAVNTIDPGRYVAVAALGTAVTAAHVDALASRVPLRARGLVTALDADDAGNNAAVRAYTQLARETDITRRAALPPGHDPADVLGRDGRDALRHALDSQTPLVEHAIDAKVQRWAGQLQWVEGRLGALRDAATLVAALPPEQATAQMTRLAARLDLHHSTVTGAVLDAVPQVLAANAASTRAPRSPDSESAPKADAPRRVTRRGREDLAAAESRPSSTRSGPAREQPADAVEQLARERSERAAKLRRVAEQGEPTTVAPQDATASRRRPSPARTNQDPATPQGRDSAARRVDAGSEGGDAIGPRKRRQESDDPRRDRGRERREGRDDRADRQGRDRGIGY